MCPSVGKEQFGSTKLVSSEYKKAFLRPFLHSLIVVLNFLQKSETERGLTTLIFATVKRVSSYTVLQQSFGDICVLPRDSPGISGCVT